MLDVLSNPPNKKTFEKIETGSFICTVGSSSYVYKVVTSSIVPKYILLYDPLGWEYYVSNGIQLPVPYQVVKTIGASNHSIESLFDYNADPKSFRFKITTNGASYTNQTFYWKAWGW